MTADQAAQAAIADAVDRLVAAAMALRDLTASHEADRVILEGAGLALRRIADPRLRDLVDTARRP